MEPTKIELEILREAKNIFLEKGFANTSTSDIAQKVGCNQALIHYYYRTKENLFQKVFLSEVQNALTIISKALDTNYNLSFENTVDKLISSYFEALSNNPRLPFFLVNELLLNAERRTFIRENFIKNPLRIEAYRKFQALVQMFIDTGQMRAIEPFDVLLNVVSLVAATFLSFPLYSDLLERNEKQRKEFLANRKEEIKKLLMQGMKK